MLELKKIIAEHQTTIEGIIKEISEVSKKHAQVKAEIVSNSEELERVRKDIDTLKKWIFFFIKMECLNLRILIQMIFRKYSWIKIPLICYVKTRQQKSCQ